MIELVGLEDVAGRKIRKLSGGMRRRVAIAQALLGDPQVLILDEPTAGLDPEQRLRFREVVSHIAATSTVLLSTHQTDDVAALCDRVLVLHDGHVRFAGTPAALAARADGHVWLADQPGHGARASWRTATGEHRVVGPPPPGRAADRAHDRRRLPDARRAARADGGIGVTATTIQARPAASRSPILGVAAVEAVRLVRHPAFLVGLLLSWLQLVQSLFTRSEEWDGQRYFVAMTANVWVCAGTLVAAACMAGRDRWLRDVELFPATPVTPGGRMAGTAVALAAPVAVTTVSAIAAAAWLERRGGFPFGDAPFTSAINPPAAQWVQGPVLVALAGIVGIAVSQLPRLRLIALFLVTAVTWVCGIAPWLFGMHPFRVLHPFMYPAYEARISGDTLQTWTPGDPPLLRPVDYAVYWREVRFDTSALWWHLGYVAGFVLLLAWAAIALADRGTRRRSLLVIGVLLVVGCGTAQLLTAGRPS